MVIWKLKTVEIVTWQTYSSLKEKRDGATFLRNKKDTCLSNRYGQYLLIKIIMKMIKIKWTKVLKNLTYWNWHKMEDWM